MSAAKPESAFPNYFELFQNIASPFMAGSGANPASNAAAMMMATMDPKEIERKTRELETVLMWLKAQVGVVEMSIKTLEYQKTFLTQMAATSASGSAEKADAPTVDAPNLSELAKTAAAMNPALWAWNLMQQPTAAANPDTTQGGSTNSSTKNNTKSSTKSSAKKRAGNRTNSRAKKSSDAVSRTRKAKPV